MATRSRVALLADASPRLAVLPPDAELLRLLEELLRPEVELLLPEEALLLLGAALLRLLEEELRLLDAAVLRPVEEPPRLEEERPRPCEAAPPSLATLSRVALLAEASPRLEVLRLEETFDVEELPDEDLREAERPPAAEAPSEVDRLLPCAFLLEFAAMC